MNEWMNWNAMNDWMDEWVGEGNKACRNDGMKWHNVWTNTLNIKMTLNQWYNAIGIAGQFNFFCIKCHRPVYAIDWNRNVNMFEPSLKWNSIKLPNLSRKLRFKWHFLCQSVARINTICVISRVGSSLLSKHAFFPQRERGNHILSPRRRRRGLHRGS